MAGFALAVLLGGLELPSLGLVLEGEPAPLCGKGRCCCEHDNHREETDPCLRRGCGCGHPDAAPAGELLRTKAVLPGMSLPVLLEPHVLPRADGDAVLLTRPHSPLVPPPKRALPARPVPLSI